MTRTSQAERRRDEHQDFEKLDVVAQRFGVSPGRVRRKIVVGSAHRHDAHARRSESPDDRGGWAALVKAAPDHPTEQPKGTQ